jgi:AraC family transcriptional regulator
MDQHEGIPFFGSIGVEAFQAPAGFHVPRHGHEGVHFTLVVDGGFEELAGSRDEIQSGELRISPPGDEHELRFGSGGASCLIVSIEPGWFVEAAGGRPPTERRKAAHPLAGAWAAALTEATADPGPHARLQVESVVLEMAGWSRSGGRRSIGPMPAWLLDLRNRLRDAPLSPPTFEELSRLANRHPVYVARAFKRHFGRAIGDYVRDLRLVAAARLLREDKDPLVDVAVACGFSDQAHFARWMKRRTGSTPGQVRRASSIGQP